MVVAVMLLSNTVNAQIKNAKTESVKVYGNCGMCKTTIEKAGNVKKVAKVDWNQETQMATLTFDASVTNQDEILKRIALAGYDSEKFLAPDEVYNNLHGCCQYDRVAKVPVKEQNKSVAGNDDYLNHGNQSQTTAAANQNKNPLKAVFDNYFLLKDALVSADGIKAASASRELLAAVNAIKMDKLDMDSHMVWMKVVNTLKEDADHIADTKDVKHQRDHFTTLSKDVYTLIKASKYEGPVYFQFCPMYNDGKGANWLSRENAVKNPYYGSMMLNCGKTVETIK